MTDTLATRMGGVLVPATTPFDPVTGEVAPVSMRENLRRWLADGADGIVLFGSTGEGVLLDDDEKRRLTALAREVVPAGVPLLGGAGADSLRATLRQCHILAESGVDAVLIHPPPYFGPYLSAEAMRVYFEAVADGSPVPVVLYHMPKFTHVTLEPALVAELVRHPNVVGLKDSSGDLKRLAEYSDACGERCRLLVGNGTLMYTALELGCAGGILAVALLAMKDCAEIVRHHRAGESQAAGKVQERIAPVHREVVATWGAVGVKAGLDLLGLAGGPPRPPLRPLGAREQKQVARVMQGAHLL
ncbi:MAG: dihydrodipicolinate synthase family protein [Gemmatimonadota bacterium]